MVERFTEKQGQFLAFIYNYTVMFGRPPAEADLQRFFGTTPPTIHQMLRKLADRNLIRRTPGQARSVEVLVDPDEIPRSVRSKAPDIRDRSAGGDIRPFPECCSSYVRHCTVRGAVR